MDFSFPNESIAILLNMKRIIYLKVGFDVTWFIRLMLDTQNKNRKKLTLHGNSWDNGDW